MVFEDLVVFNVFVVFIVFFSVFLTGRDYRRFIVFARADTQWQVFYFRIAEEASCPRFDTHIIRQSEAETA